MDGLRGILAELSEHAASGALSFAADLISEAQSQNDPVAWVAGTDSIFYPPDLAERGVDLQGVAVVRTGGGEEALLAAEWLLRSGAFGLVVVDWEGQDQASDASLGRLLKLAEKSAAGVLFLTSRKPSQPSLGSRISLRGCVSRTGDDRQAVSIHTVKDKRSVPGPRITRCYSGPPGMHQH